MEGKQHNENNPVNFEELIGSIFKNSQTSGDGPSGPEGFENKQTKELLSDWVKLMCESDNVRESVEEYNNKNPDKKIKQEDVEKLEKINTLIKMKKGDKDADYHIKMGELCRNIINENTNVPRNNNEKDMLSTLNQAIDMITTESEINSDQAKDCVKNLLGKFKNMGFDMGGNNFDSVVDNMFSEDYLSKLADQEGQFPDMGMFTGMFSNMNMNMNMNMNDQTRKGFRKKKSVTKNARQKAKQRQTTDANSILKYLDNVPDTN